MAEIKVTDNDLSDVLLFEELKRYLTEIELSTEAEKNALLRDIVKAEMEGRQTWLTKLLKHSIMDETRRRSLLEAIRNGKIYEELKAV